MVIGFIGSGSMAAAMARGWAGESEGMLFSDAGSGRAKALAEELGGEALGNSQVAERADLLVLAVKPAKLDRGGAGAAGGATASSRSSPRSRSSAVAEAFPGAEVLRVMPNVGVEVRKGVLCVAGEASEATRAKLELLGHVVDLAGRGFRRGDRGDGLRAGLPGAGGRGARRRRRRGRASTPSCARELVVETTAGTAELLRVRHPADVRRAVASPGGSTEAGLEALDREGAREAFEAAVAASLERMRAMIVAAVTSRSDVADYVSALFIVYIDPDLLQHPASPTCRGCPTTAWLRAVLDFVTETDQPLPEHLPALDPAGRRRRLRLRPRPDPRPDRPLRRAGDRRRR